jgi:two-component system cell cycle response regulator DivK
MERPGLDAKKVRRLVLLVDRDADTRQMYAEYLRRDGWQTDEASDGREALAKAIALHPEVIATETRLPGIDGYELCDLLRRDASTCATAILVVTGDAFTPEVERAKQAGADAVLVKPCLPETLLDEIRKVLSRAPVHAPRPRARAMLSATEAGSRRGVRRGLRAHLDTAPAPPPSLVCPLCDRPLVHQRSHVGGVSASYLEQWDYFDCPGGCGTFQYRARTRKLKLVG